MKVIKRYGETTPKCQCGRPAIYKNDDGIASCRQCKDKKFELRCACGSILEARSGKYGAYYFCWKCNRNVSIAMARRMGAQFG
jgi:hypothetical protein